MAQLDADSRYILVIRGGGFVCLDDSEEPKPFATARCCSQEKVGNYAVFDNLSLENYRRDAPAEPFVTQIPKEDRAQEFVDPSASTLRGLYGVDAEATYGVNPALEFLWNTDLVRAGTPTPLRESFFVDVIVTLICSRAV